MIMRFVNNVKKATIFIVLIIGLVLILSSLIGLFHLYYKENLAPSNCPPEINQKEFYLARNTVNPASLAGFDSASYGYNPNGFCNLGSKTGENANYYYCNLNYITSKMTNSEGIIQEQSRYSIKSILNGKNCSVVENLPYSDTIKTKCPVVEIICRKL